MVKEIINFAFNYVRNFQQYDPIKRSKNKFNFEYSVPSISGISKYQWGKDIESVKPSTLEYIIFYLHNIEPKLLEDSLIAYFYYWKIRMKDNKRMKKEYDRIIEHYTKSNKEECLPRIYVGGWGSCYIVYSISFYVGSQKVNKFGFTADENRYSKLLSDLRSKYPNVSVGSLKVNQEIGFDDEQQVKEFEKEALVNLKSHPQYKKCRFCFDGYRESYIN